MIAIATIAGSCGGRTTSARDGAVASGGQSGSIATGGTTALVGTGGSATGGTTAPAGTGGGATGGATGGAIADAGLPGTDGGPSVSPFESSCSGEPKLSREGTTVAVPVTAYRLSMASCCAARYGILFHSQDAWGSDVEVEVMQTEGGLAPGDYLVADAWRPMRVVLTSQRVDASSTAQLASGTVRIVGDPAGEAPFQLGLSVHWLSSDIATASTFFCVPSISIAPDAWASRLQLFLLEDEKLSTFDVAELPLDTLVLAQDPILDLGRIASVTKASGEIRLLENSDFGKWVRDVIQGRSLLLMPFVVVADGARIYLGSFVSSLSSAIGPVPWVEAESMSADRFRIAPSGPDTDPRWDARILKVLGESSRLVE
jgi:hypothetical protein